MKREEYERYCQALNDLGRLYTLYLSHELWTSGEYREAIGELVLEEQRLASFYATNKED